MLSDPDEQGKQKLGLAQVIYSNVMYATHPVPIMMRGEEGFC